MILNRRHLVGAAAAGLLLPGWARGNPASPMMDNLPSPLIGDEQFRSIQVWHGIRPHRAGSYRLEVDASGPKFLIHNYGHGGGGITLSWGCARRVLDILLHQAASLPARDVAVLGSGVIGLTVATLLVENGYTVTVYTEENWQNTTSAIAGGQFAPSVIDYDDEEDFQSLVNASYAEHVRRGVGYGVVPRDNYTHGRTGELNSTVGASNIAPVSFPRLPFRHMNVGGWKYSTLLVNPRTLLPRLERDLIAAQVKFVKKTITNTSIGEINHPIVVSCLGMGSKKVWNDNKILTGRKGILAVLPRQSGLSYLYSGIGYMFPRSDGLIIGGSIEEVSDAEAGNGSSARPATRDELDKARFFLKVMRSVFDGDIPVPEWFSGKTRILEAMMFGRDPDLDTVPAQTP